MVPCTTVGHISSMVTRTTEYQNVPVEIFSFGAVLSSEVFRKGEFMEGIQSVSR